MVRMMVGVRGEFCGRMQALYKLNKPRHRERLLAKDGDTLHTQTVPVGSLFGNTGEVQR